jgi:hypothetical protein
MGRDARGGPWPGKARRGSTTVRVLASMDPAAPVPSGREGGLREGGYRPSSTTQMFR